MLKVMTDLKKGFKKEVIFHAGGKTSRPADKGIRKDLHVKPPAETGGHN
jgi:hypothetical protein